MLAVIFEVFPTKEGKADYLDIAASLRQHLEKVDGCLSIERFQSLIDEQKILSLSFWRDEDAIREWRNVIAHRAAQQKGRDGIFERYRIRVAHVVRDYTHEDRAETPSDSVKHLR